MAAGLRRFAAIGSSSVAAGLCHVKAPSAAEERSWRNPTYMPPARIDVPFAHISSSSSDDPGISLAWAVKNLDVDRAKGILDKWPHGATLVDKDNNTLFHIAALENQRFGSQPEAAKEMMHVLLKNGWQVVDQKNKNGERAEVVAKRAAPNGVPSKLLKARSHDFSEKLRAERQLQLVGEQSAVPWEWEYRVQDDQRRAYAGVALKSVPQEKCSRWMETAWNDAPWHVMEEGRKVAWFVAEDCIDCPYRYSGHEHPGNLYPQFMQEITEEVCGRICGIPKEEWPNCCNVVAYDDAKAEVGWHSDDEVYFQSLSDDTRIISFSLGASRDFLWRLQGTDNTLGCVSLGDGDVMTMEGLFQKHYKHSVPKSLVPCGKRLNFTFRYIVAKAHADDAETAAVTGVNSAAK